MNDDRIGYLSSEQLLFLSPWKPVETDTTSLEGRTWVCPNCEAERTYFRSLARLEGAKNQFMIQCPACDHLIVARIHASGDSAIATQFGGPHIDRFLRFLDQRMREEET